MNSTLLISIITPCLNRVRFITEAVESVQHQEYAGVQHIIMDGGSTDGTLALLARFPHLQVVSQPDQGIYDAMNKGIRLAQGEVFGFLNTDDLYEPGIFPLVAQAFTDHPGLRAIVGGASIFYEKTPGERVIYNSFASVSPGALLCRATQGAPIFNAWFFRRSLFDELGDFDTRYAYVADRDFLIRMAFQGISYGNLEVAFYRYRMHPGSFTLSGRDSGEAGYMFESRSLAERYIRQKGIPQETKNCFKVWHSQITAEQTLTARRKKAFRRALGYTLNGIRYHSGWPIVFLRKVIEQLSPHSV